MTPQTVNAVNLPLQNALNFPAAILDRPFFDPEASDAFNYGAIGAVMGHEISHSFDNQGATFDAEGRLHNWWTKADFAHFQQSGKALAAQFDAYFPFPDLHVRGQQTLGENIADNAGHDGLVRCLDRLAGRQARADGPGLDAASSNSSWPTPRSGPPRRARRRSGRRSPPTSMRRANSARWKPRNMDAWYAAFNVKPGEKLYLAPDSRVHVW